MITIIMNSNKHLKINSTAPVYQFENNTDEIMCLLPSLYGNIFLSECTVMLCFYNRFDQGKSIVLAQEKYNDSYLKFKGLLNFDMTIVDGSLKIWLEITNKNNELLLKTDCAILNIIEAVKINDEYAPELLPVLSQWVIQMNQIKNETINVLKNVTEQANIATEAASLAIKIFKEIQGSDEKS